MARQQTKYADSLPITERNRYTEKLLLIGNKCPFEIDASLWVNNPKEWPETDYGDIWTYLIDTPGIYTQGVMKNRKSLEAHRFFSGGWVDVVLHYKHGDLIIFKTRVRRSWRVTEKPHNTWVAAHSDGSVKVAHCDCMAGLGESCSHIAALLFKLETSVRLGYTTTAPTDVACIWNTVCTKKVEAAMVKDIEFYSAKAKSKRNVSMKKRPVPKARPEHEQQFLQMMHQTRKMAVGHSTFKDYAHDYKPKPWFANLASFTEEEVEAIESKTKGQASSASWHQERVGRVTGTTAHRVISTPQEEPSKSLVKDILTKGSVNSRLSSPAIVWGREHEKDAIHTYKLALGLTSEVPAELPTIIIANNMYKVHQNIKIKSAGFKICKDKPYIGASSDGTVNCDCCGKGVIEAKCPLKWIDVPYDQWPADRTGHLETVWELKKKHSYYTQVQLQMYTSKAMYADFITWTPKNTVIFRVQRDAEFLDTAVDKISRFWAKHIYPHLVGTSVPDTEMEQEMELDTPDAEQVDEETRMELVSAGEE